MELEGRPELVNDILGRYPSGYGFCMGDNEKYKGELRKLGIFDSTFGLFVYSEDLELCARFYEEGDKNYDEFENNWYYIDDNSYVLEKFETAETFSKQIFEKRVNNQIRNLEYNLMDWDAKPQRREDVLREKYGVIEEKENIELSDLIKKTRNTYFEKIGCAQDKLAASFGTAIGSVGLGVAGYFLFDNGLDTNSITEMTLGLYAVTGSVMSGIFLISKFRDYLKMEKEASKVIKDYLMGDKQ